MKRNLKDRFKIVGRYIYIIIIASALVAIGTYFYTSKLPGYYKSESIVLVSSEKEKDVNNFIIHLKSLDLLNSVKDELKLSYSDNKIKDMVSVLNIKNSDMIKITVKSEKQGEAKAIIDSMINTFQVSAVDYYSDANIKIVENSQTADIKEFVDVNLYTLISGLTSLVFLSLLFSNFGSLEVDIKNHEDLKRYLNMKSLGIVPDNTVDDETGNKKKKNQETDIKIINDPSSMISESYRMIRTNLDFLDLKVINFTSTTASEGKSEVISNIALSFGMIGKKVLVIDCDLRKPVIHKKFNVNRSLGLSDIVLYNRINEYKNMVQSFKINNDQKIDILTAGSKIYNPSELLNSNRFKNLIEKVKEDYDLILIDCPPISLMTDAVIVSKLSDGTAYIIESNRTNHAAIQSCVDQLNDVNAFVLGGILTKVNIKKQKKLYGNKYDYYYSNYM